MRPIPTDRGDCPFDPPTGMADEALGKVRLATGDDVWLVARHHLVRQVLADTRFSSELDGGLRGVPLHAVRPEPGMFIQMDPPEHTRLRRMLTGRFTVQRMNRLRPQIEQIVADQLDVLEQQPRPADLVANFALPIPSLVICELLGVPYEDRQEFQHAAALLVDLTGSPEELEAGMLRLGEYLLELIARKRAEPGEGLIDELLDSGLRDEELVGIAVVSLIAGHETTANMLGLGTLALLQHPEQLALVRQSPETARTAVDELLRYLSIIDTVMLRRASIDLELDGQVIPEGDFVSCSLASANRDPALLERPGELDVTRPKTPHVAFGFGPHQCLGQNLARLEMEIAYPALFRRLPKLRLAVPLSEVPFKKDVAVYGVHRLEVEW
ncbi:cytochrome P450 [Nonomuraea sp. NPDC003804]|uniref:cytochrome P450 n=1 Tax=Nonomuraea sp. NPDC003804 TaxID=3154547 RepID=UPI0033BAF6E8